MEQSIFLSNIRELKKIKKVDIECICSKKASLNLPFRTSVTLRIIGGRGPKALNYKAQRFRAFQKHVYNIKIRHLRDLRRKSYVHYSHREITSLYSFFLLMVFIPSEFSMTRFLTRHYVIKD